MEEPTNVQQTETESATTPNVLNPIQRQELLDNQNLFLGLVGGLTGAAIGAGLWSLVTTWTGYQISWMAVGVGFLVGLGIRILGRGATPIFGVMGALLSLGACLAGNYLTVGIIASRELGIPLMEALLQTDLIIQVMQEASFGLIDLLFYGIALYTGFKLSFNPEPT
jgi:hypothetical protein